MKGQRIFYSAVMLTGVNLLMRLGGTVFQVYLSGRIGAQGVGLLQLVLSVGSMTAVAGMAGIRTATMYLTAEQIGRNRPGGIIWVLSACTGYSLLCSILVGTAVYALAPHIAAVWIGYPEVTAAIRLLAVFLPVNCLCGVMTGYFTGAGRIGTLTSVEVIEQILAAAITVAGLHFWASASPQRACLCVIAGSGLGACFTLATLTALRIRERGQKSRPVPMKKRLAATALPLALADDLRTGISTAENLMVPKRLGLYQGADAALGTFGTVSAMVFPLLMFPASVLFGMNELLIPELARCNAAGSKARIRHLVERGLKVATVYGAACSGILYLCAGELCGGLYANAEAGRYLQWFAPLAVMLYCDSVTDAMLKGLGLQKISVRYNIITNILDIGLLYALLPRIGISGYFISFSITHGINFFLSFRRLMATTGQRLRLAPSAAVLLWGVLAVLLCRALHSGTIKAACFSALFAALLALSGTVSKQDLDWIKGLVRKK